MNRNLSQGSDVSKLNAIDDDQPIHNKIDIINERSNDVEADLELDRDKNTSRVLITGRFCLNKNNKYELECEATVDGVPVVTHKEAIEDNDIYLDQHNQCCTIVKPEVQDHQIQTDLTKDDIISHDDFVYKICHQGLHPAELNLHILFKGNSAEDVTLDGRKIPCTVTTGKQDTTGKQVKKTNSNKSNKQAGKTSSATKTKRPFTANRKSNVNSKQSSPHLSPSKKSTREKLNEDKAIKDKKPQKDKYKFNSFKPKIPPLKKKIEKQNINAPKADQTKKTKPWKSMSPFRKTKNEASKKDAENPELKVLYQNEKKSSIDSKYDDDTAKDRPRSYSTAIPRRSVTQGDNSKEVREKNPLLGSVSKNSIQTGARTVNSLRILVTGEEAKVLPDVKKSPKPSTSQVPTKRSPPGSINSKSPNRSPKLSPRSTSPPKVASPSDLLSQYPCCKKCSECKNLVSGGDQCRVEKRLSPKGSPLRLKPTSSPTNKLPCGGICAHCTKNQLSKNGQCQLDILDKKTKAGKPSPTNRLAAESPKMVSRSSSPIKMSSREEVYKQPCSGKCTSCIKSQLGKDYRGPNVSPTNSLNSKLAQPKRLSKESPKSSRSGSPSKVPAPAEVLRHPCCEKCNGCLTCEYNRIGNNSQPGADRSSRTKARGKVPLTPTTSPTSPTSSRRGSPTFYSRATSPPSNCANRQCIRECPKLNKPVEQDERQKKKKMLIERFIQEMDGESEVAINFINKKNFNVMSSNPNHTKVTVNIDSERELYDLMFRKNSNNFGNLTVKQTTKQSLSPKSSFNNSKKSKPNYGYRQDTTAPNNNNSRTSATFNVKVPGPQYQDQLLNGMGDDKITKPQTKNGRGRGVSVSFNKFDVKENTSYARRLSPVIAPRHQSIPAALKYKLDQISDSDVHSIGNDNEIPEKEMFHSNDYKMHVPESTPTNRKYSAIKHDENNQTGKHNNDEERRSTFDSAVGGAVELPNRISTAEDEIRILSANDVIYGEALETLATSNPNELVHAANSHLTKSMISLLNVTDSLVAHGHNGPSRRGSGFGSNYTVSKINAPDTLDINLKHEQRHEAQEHAFENVPGPGAYINEGFDFLLTEATPSYIIGTRFNDQ